ncbi:MAG: helix-turn-helix domain-containing protein [Roseburia sp.]|nr:helix-turn-helix domain-containing protein [Roseburia sp.]MCM1099240.1 helix-turn-helix domain-containing protein [Ruminococcus flavefaciens]
MTLGQNLAKLRIESNMGQKELALRLNVSIGTVSNYENDVHSPTPETLGKLADCFGVSVDYLLGRTRFRYDIQQLERQLSNEYTVTDFVNMVVSFDSSAADNLMAYAQFLQARQQKKDM